MILSQSLYELQAEHTISASFVPLAPAAASTATTSANSIAKHPNGCMQQSYAGLHAEICREDRSPEALLVLPLHGKQAPLHLQLSCASPV